MDLHFLLTVQWFDVEVHYQFLKSDRGQNNLGPELSSKIWVPRLKFDYIERTIANYRVEAFVERRGAPYLEEGLG